MHTRTNCTKIGQSHTVSACWAEHMPNIEQEGECDWAPCTALGSSMASYVQLYEHSLVIAR